jgi:hypothetical protein
MTFNSRNAEFETTNTEKSSEENNSQETISTDDQISNQSSSSSRSNENISDAAFSQAQRMKIADIVVAALRMNRQNNPSSKILVSDMSFVTSSLMSIIFDAQLER